MRLKFATKDLVLSSLVGASSMIPAILLAVPYTLGVHADLMQVDSILELLTITACAMLIALALLLCFGVPAFLLLNKYNRVSILSISALALAPASIHALAAYAADGKTALFFFLAIGYFSLWAATSCYCFLKKRSQVAL